MSAFHKYVHMIHTLPDSIPMIGNALYSLDMLYSPDGKNLSQNNYKLRRVLRSGLS